jgi:hypothetical protein
LRAFAATGNQGLAAERAGVSRWMEEHFLGEMRRWNNVREACRRAGVTRSSYEAHWRKWPGFRERVREARAFASLWLAAQREREGERPLEPPDLPGLEAIPTIAERIRLLRRHLRRR